MHAYANRGSSNLIGFSASGRGSSNLIDLAPWALSGRIKGKSGTVAINKLSSGDNLPGSKNFLYNLHKKIHKEDYAPKSYNYSF